jgi:hypothetical protein
MPVIPLTWEVNIERIAVGGQCRQKVSKSSISMKKMGMVVFACHPSYTGSISRKITVLTRPWEDGEHKTLYEK